MVWSELARAVMPNGDVLTLRASGADFEIRCNLFELMSSKNPASERVLAQAACARIARQSAQVLIGGLGLGYTVGAVLDETGDQAKIAVAELVPEIIHWNRGPLADLAGRPLDDPRVAVHNADVTTIIRENPSTFDAILLDVDNGPEAVLFPSNEFLYSIDGVKLALSGLKSDGVLGVWSADRAPHFERVLERGRFAFERTDVATLGPDGPAHTIYLVWASVPSAAET